MIMVSMSITEAWQYMWECQDFFCVLYWLEKLKLHFYEPAQCLMSLPSICEAQCFVTSEFEEG